MEKTIDNRRRPWYYKDNKTRAQARKELQMEKTILYKKVDNDPTIKGERVTITRRDDKIVISQFIDFYKSGLVLWARDNESAYCYNACVTTFIQRGYHRI